MDDGFHSPTPAGTKAVDGSLECRSTVEDVAFIREDWMLLCYSLFESIQFSFSTICFSTASSSQNADTPPQIRCVLVRSYGAIVSPLILLDYTALASTPTFAARPMQGKEQSMKNREATGGRRKWWDPWQGLKMRSPAESFWWNSRFSLFPIWAWAGPSRWLDLGCAHT